MLFLPFALIFMIGGIWFYWQIKNQPDYQNEGNNTKYLFKKRKRLKRKLGIIKYHTQGHLLQLENKFIPERFLYLVSYTMINI